MSNLLKNIIRFILFAFVQIFILDQVPLLHQFIKPYIYFLFILWLPFSLSRFWQMIIAFFFGLTMDYFTQNFGLHAAPCVLIAFLRPTILNILIAKETTEQNYVEPSIKSMGFGPYSIYVAIFVVVHHFYLVLIEWLQFGNFFYFIGKVIASSAISLLLILITEMLFYRNSKLRVV
jgi:hypothetical protein